MLRRIGVLAAIVAVVAAALAYAAPRNGGFEARFDGWTTFTSNPDGGRWRTYKAGDEPLGDIGPPRGGVVTLKPFFKPPKGKRAAVTDQTDEGLRILQRNLKLKPDRRIRLSLFVFYRNYAGDFVAPNTLDFETGPNQQYRIDLLKPGAPRASIAGGDIVKTLFRTRHGDPRTLRPKKLTFNLTRFAGDKLRLRFAEVDNQFYLHAGVDAVRLRYKPLD